MIRRLIENDIKANKLSSAATFFFMAVSAMLLCLTVLLRGSLLGSIDHLMEEAQTPDFLQMHAGEADEVQITAFAGEQEEVEQWQLCRFLNLENAILSLNGRSLSGNTQDNGLCVQSPSFDYLLDTEDHRVSVQEGEVYVPVCYRREYGLEQGQLMQIGSESLRIAGFIRDSQMNSMMASSKRFLVNEADYVRFREIGSEEYLIEFLLREGSDVDAFALAYTESGLPANGPTITAPLIRMMNALSDGMMILVIFLVSIVALLISMLCIRFLLLTTLEKDQKEIGMLKAVGISKTDIRRLYLTKFILLSATGAAAGLLLAVCLSKPLGTQMRELYGAGVSGGLVYAASVFSVLLAEGILLLSIRRTLKRTEKLSAVEALNGSRVRKKKHAYLLVGAVTAAAVFLMLTPQNIAHTISSPEFVTYMGVGNGQIRIDVRQSEDIVSQTAALAGQLERDNRVERYTVLQTRSLQGQLADGSACALMVEFGDHSIFPISYTEGTFPQKEGDLALSALNAEDLGLGLGDTVLLSAQGEQRQYTVCGIYSDITNGGKTAKACETGRWETVPVMWSILYTSLRDGESVENWLAEYRSRYGETGMEAVDIQEYVTATYGQTIRQLQLAERVSFVTALGILFIVVLLFLRLVIEQERRDSALKKALGFTTGAICGEYRKRATAYSLAGIFIGMVLGVFLGERVAGLLLSSLGASGFHFVLDDAWIFLRTFAAALLVSLAAAQAALREIKRIRAREAL